MDVLVHPSAIRPMGRVAGLSWLQSSAPMGWIDEWKSRPEHDPLCLAIAFDNGCIYGVFRRRKAKYLGHQYSIPVHSLTDLTSRTAALPLCWCLQLKDPHTVRSGSPDSKVCSSTSYLETIESKK